MEKDLYSSVVNLEGSGHASVYEALRELGLVYVSPPPSFEENGQRIRMADDVMATGFTWCPPFAMMEAFTRVCDLGALMKERLKPEILGNVDIDHIIAEQIKSKYDYRIYFKAK